MVFSDMLGDYCFSQYSFPFIIVQFIFYKTFLDTIHEKYICCSQALTHYFSFINPYPANVENIVNS